MPPPDTGQRAPLSDVNPNIRTSSRIRSLHKRKSLESSPENHLPNPPQPKRQGAAKRAAKQAIKRAAKQTADQTDDVMAVYELVNLTEDVQDSDFVDIKDDPEEPDISDGRTRFCVTRLLAIAQEAPKDITPFLGPGVSLPIVKANVERFKPAS
ncbi:unnamed protein product [Fusarium equiseti]|uniref:Uncharacterized protein n=1 Tax=Fusarium equiseti TaxID=61235 RepID=A0A8J2IIZ4_FUSEQ|nr:unnamed protein product [Fusarium equiseti]